MALDFEFARVGRNGDFTADVGTLALEGSRTGLFEDFLSSKAVITQSPRVADMDASAGLTDVGNSMQDLLASAATLFGVDKAVQEAAAPDQSTVKQPQTTMQDLQAGMKALGGVVSAIASFAHVAAPNTQGQFDKLAGANDKTNATQLESMNKISVAIDAQESAVRAALGTVDRGGVVAEGQKPDTPQQDAVTPPSVGRSLLGGAFAGSVTGALLGNGPLGAAVAAVTTLTDVAQMASAMGQGSLGRPTANTASTTIKTREQAARAEMDSTAGSRGPVAGTFEQAAYRANNPVPVMENDKLSLAEINLTKSSITDVGGAKNPQSAELNGMLAEIEARRTQLAPQLTTAKDLDQRFADIRQNGQQLNVEGALSALDSGARVNRSGSEFGFNTAV